MNNLFTKKHEEENFLNYEQYKEILLPYELIISHIISFKEMKFGDRRHSDHRCHTECHPIFLHRFRVWKALAEDIVGSYEVSSEQGEKVYLSDIWNRMLQTLRIMWKTSNKKIYSCFDVPTFVGETIRTFYHSQSAYYWRKGNPNAKLSPEAYQKSPERKIEKEVERERGLAISKARRDKLSRVLFQSGLFRVPKILDEADKITSSFTSILFDDNEGTTGEQAIQAMMGCMKSLYKRSDSMKDPERFVDEVLDTVGKAQEGISEVSGVFESIKKMTQNAFRILVDYGPMFVFLTSAVSHIIYRTKTSLVFCICSGIVLIYQHKDIFFDGILKFLSRYTNFSFQDGLDDVSDAISSLMTLFAVKYSKDKCSELISSITNFDRRSGGVKRVVEIVKKFTTFVYNSLAGTCGFSKLYLFPRGYDELSEIVFDRWEDICRRIDKNDFPYTEDTYAELMLCLSTCRKFVQEFRVTPSNRHVYQEVVRVQHEMRKLREKMAASNFRESGYRVEPVTLVLTGIPGVGKSNLIELISLDFCMKTLPKHEREHIARVGHCNDYMYVRATENDFWDGYTSKSVVAVFDDVGQKRPTSCSEDEFFSFIRACQSFDYILKMASLEGKGNVHFRSRLIIATSNVTTQFESNFIRDQRALQRRLKFRFEVKLRPEFATSEGKLDVTKLPRDEEDNPYFSDEMFYFISQDERGSPIERCGRTCHTYSELMEMTVAELDMNSQLRDNKENYIRRRISKYVTEEKFVDAPDINMEHVEFQQSWFREMYRYELNQEMNILVDRHRASCEECRAAPRTPNIVHLSEELLNVIQALRGNTRGRVAASTILEHYSNGGCELFRPLIVLDDRPDELWEMEYFNSFHYAMVNFRQEGWKRYILDPYMYLVDGCIKLCDSVLFPLGLGDSHLVRFVMMYFLGQLFANGSGYALKWSFAKLKSIFVEGNMDISEKQLAEIQRDQLEYYTQVTQQGTYQFRHNSSQKSAKARLNNLKEHFKLQGFASNDKQCDVITKKILAENQYAMYFVTPSVKQFCGLATFVRGRVLMIPMHFVVSIGYAVSEDLSNKESYKVLLEPTDGTERKGFEVSIEPFVQECMRALEGELADNVMHKDFVFVRMPNSVKAHKDIVKFFWTRKESEGATKVPIRFCSLDQGVYCHHVSTGFTLAERPVVTSSDELTSYNSNGFAYKATTGKGDCGALIFRINKFSDTGKITGIHVSGNTASELGFSQHIVREDIEEFVKDETIFNLDLEKPEAKVVQLQGAFRVVGKNEIRHSPYSKTSLKKSLLHGDNHFSKLPVSTAPAKLTPFTKGDVIVDPYEVAIKKYIPTTEFRPKMPILDAAVLQVKEKLLNVFGLPEMRTFTFEEAVCGVNDRDTFKSLTRSSSSGYPLSKKGISKKIIFGEEGQYDLETEHAKAVKREVEFVIEKARQRVRVKHLFTDNLKDETRSLEKVESGNTRLFCGAPLVYTIAVRMFFGDFMSLFQQHGMEFGSAIGLNPFGMDWHELTLRLLAQGNNPASKAYGAGDYKAFDASEHPSVHWKIFEIIDGIYNLNGCGADSTVRRILWEEVVNSQHVVFDAEYEWTNSLPSGHPLTSIINTMYNHVSFVYCFDRMQFDLDHMNWRFYDNVYLIAMGDDNLFACSKAVREHFGESTVARYMSELGLTYTSDVKTESKSGLRTLSDVSFLKRKFRYDTQTVSPRWVAPISLDVILDLPQWYRDGPLTQEQLVSDNVRSALCELSLHGKETFREVVAIFRETIVNSPLKISAPLFDYDLARTACQEQVNIF